MGEVRFDVLNLAMSSPSDRRGTEAVGTKYVYQGVNGSFKISSEISKLSEPSSGVNEKQTTAR